MSVNLSNEQSFKERKISLIISFRYRINLSNYTFLGKYMYKFKITYICIPIVAYGVLIEIKNGSFQLILLIFIQSAAIKVM